MKKLLVILLLSFTYSQCDECNEVWIDPYWGEQCCDAAWDQWGFDCGYMESEYGWDCTGCSCPYDQNSICGDGYCNGNESIDICPSDCTINGCNTNDQVDDCYDNDCCPVSWIGDGYQDCAEPNNFGCDLSCYNNDGGDCDGEILIGDINNDGGVDILDIIGTINLIFDSGYNSIVDLNYDNSIDILDIILIVDIILN